MWLLDVDTLALVGFQGDPDENYAILSHTWGNNEVTFRDIQDLAIARTKAGFAKIQYSCQQARKDGLAFCWVDTCCINKDSTSELSEAINSMYRWYYNAEVCYAYVEDAFDIRVRGQYILDGCRWLTRGWTLQEMLAPAKLVFFNAEWNRMGTRKTLAWELARLTGVTYDCLWDRDRIYHYSIAQKLSWASRRLTTRIEDQAYCLIGLLEVNMPLLYGEGEHAFHRLQQEILKRADIDFSVLAWEPFDSSQCGLVLAPHPYCFRNQGDSPMLSTHRRRGRASWENNGLRARLPVLKDSSGTPRWIEIGSTRLLLRKVLDEPDYDAGDSTSPSYFIARSCRGAPQRLFDRYLPETTLSKAMKEIFIWNEQSWNLYVTLDLSSEIKILAAYPEAAWSPTYNDFAYHVMCPDKFGALLIQDLATKELKVLCFSIDTNGIVKTLSWTDVLSAKHRNNLIRFFTSLRTIEHMGQYTKCFQKEEHLRKKQVSTRIINYADLSDSNAIMCAFFWPFGHSDFPRNVSLPRTHSILRVWTQTTDATNQAIDPSLPSSDMLERWTFGIENESADLEASIELQGLPLDGPAL